MKYVLCCCLTVCRLAIYPLSAAVSLPLNEVASTLPTQVDGPARKAIDAFSEGRHSKAVEMAMPLAEMGNAEALYLLGYAHETGQGAEGSRDKALEYYRKAADAKHKDAVYRMSFILLASDKAEEREKAGKALEKAAQDDPAVAGRILGEAYLRGLLSKEPDAEKAVHWWKKSADSGDVTSLLLLARFHEGEFGFPEKRNGKIALEYYGKAADLGNASAMVTVGSRYLLGEKNLRDEKKGREWMDKAVDAKQPLAYFVLADFEENVRKDPEAAIKLLEKGSKEGQVDCMLRAADFYLEGKGVEKDEDKGASLMQKAAEAGHPLANLRLAVAYLAKEKLGADDAIRGYQHLVSAANANLPQAQHELGLLYLSGKLGAADGPAAVAWLTRSAQGGFAQAQFNLASLYLQGVGSVPQNLKNAGELYSLAANQGHPGALLALAKLFHTGTGTEVDLIKAWVLAMLADEAGEENGADLAKEIASKMSVVQRGEARAELEKSKKEKAGASKQDQ